MTTAPDNVDVAAIIAVDLTPLEATWVRYLRDNTVYRTNEGTTGDAICSSLCAGERILVQWQAGDRRGWNGALLYTEQYTLTHLGERVASHLPPQGQAP